ncbi:L-alanine-DL-glutamate epimerase-like enolase superfamily enzyme [Erwinia toletana]|uniref:L-alanine-DL-glutamate epimerase-like enolase superfamily enzyme n=1 Tax=Winslowiella toletana TaxID=92490 RepID=A0ABS4PAM4_9GAMM|nr:mandelate racemase/muconate lactonizing enzyme family protein [Winslowiella toletana]MBP2169695.1 L-alanine-DL-glutamate epimerase-like enolase superfamily enzyme [Winslowiella toletana]
MKITRIETTRVKSLANLLWVEIHTDEGLVGLGETFRGAEAVEAYIHSVSAPLLLGKEAGQIERHNRTLLRGYLGFNGSGVETRAASAIDIALWDLLGKSLNQPLYQLLGGLCHDRMRAYNTCAGVSFNSQGEQRRVIAQGDSKPSGRYDDQVAFLECPDELAQSLIEEGFSAMKIWPADSFAAASGGQYISSADIKKAIAPFEKIRRAVGDRIELMCEFHSLWNTSSALAIAKPLRELNIFWAEDPIKMDSPQALADYRRLSGLPVCGSETLAATSNFRDHLAADALDYVMLDLSWCGGITEAKKIAALAEAYQKPIAPHDCTGPVVLMASLHLGLSSPNAIFQEVVRAYLAGFYGDLVSTLPTLENGWLSPPQGPGLGTALSDALRARADVVVRSSGL